MTITVRAAEPSDWDAIRETMMQPRAQAGTLQVPHTSLEVFRKRAADLPAGDHMLVAEVDGKVVGNAGLHGFPRHPRMKHVVALGITVHDDYHRQGVGSALMRAAIDLADNWLQYKRIELTVYVDNVGAIALYQKFGFDIEGTKRSYAFRNGEFVDALDMARLRT